MVSSFKIQRKYEMTVWTMNYKNCCYNDLVANQPTEGDGE